jgi:putative SOS response-associated peptidase YedK
MLQLLHSLARAFELIEHGHGNFAGCFQPRVMAIGQGSEGRVHRVLAREPDTGVTNIRKVDSKHWAPWLGVESRCIVPFTSFAEASPVEGDKDPSTGRQRNYWFARNESRPLAVLAGLWTPWRGAEGRNG